MESFKITFLGKNFDMVDNADHTLIISRSEGTRGKQFELLEEILAKYGLPLHDDECVSLNINSAYQQTYIYIDQERHSEC